ncbi:MAG: amidase [Gemmatimonadota bacterium]
MPVTPPTLASLREVAEDLGFHFTEADLESFLGLMEEAVAAYEAVDEMPDDPPPVRYPRESGYRPEGEENRLGAWCVKTSVRGAASGKLAGRTVVLKDNVCLADVPMMGGVPVLEGYVPEIDATIVERILDAGAEIVGKAACEYFSASGGSHTSATGPVHNPHKRGYSAGGSSSGSAALVAAGEVDMAIGGDQGGSIRIPSSFCGAYGLKPTYGLVPYTGIMSIETTLDHVGPITASVADNALLLEVIAGPDGIDPRQRGVEPARYTDALRPEVADLRIAVVSEGFGTPVSEPVVDACVRAGAERLRALGATVEEVSIPMHTAGAAIFMPIAAEGATELMMKGYGCGTNHEGLFVLSLFDACRAWRERADELSETLKLFMLTGEYFLRQSEGRFYAKAANLRRRLRAAYDEVLAGYDLLLMPTLPMRATPLPAADAAREEIVRRGLEMLVNTQQFDLTGHPAISLPCGLSDRLPIGMMLVGRHFQESAVYRAAFAFEQSGDWREM